MNKGRPAKRRKPTKPPHEVAKDVVSYLRENRLMDVKVIWSMWLRVKHDPVTPVSIKNFARDILLTKATYDVASFRALGVAQQRELADSDPALRKLLTAAAEDNVRMAYRGIISTALGVGWCASNVWSTWERLRFMVHAHAYSYIGTPTLVYSSRPHHPPRLTMNPWDGSAPMRMRNGYTTVAVIPIHDIHPEGDHDYFNMDETSNNLLVFVNGRVMIPGFKPCRVQYGIRIDFAGRVLEHAQAEMRESVGVHLVDDLRDLVLSYVPGYVGRIDEKLYAYRQARYHRVVAEIEQFQRMYRTVRLPHGIGRCL